MDSTTLTTQALIHLLSQGKGKNPDLSLESFGYFLEDYIIKGGDITTDGNAFTIEEAVVSLGDYLYRVNGKTTRVRERGPKTYYIDFTAANGFVLNTTHPTGDEDYLTFWTINTNEAGNIVSTVDNRGEMGYIRFRSEIEGIISDVVVDEDDIVDGAVTNEKIVSLDYSKILNKPVAISEDEPSNPNDNLIWFDTAQKRIKQWDDTASKWNSFGGGDGGGDSSYTHPEFSFASASDLTGEVVWDDLTNEAVFALFLESVGIAPGSYTKVQVDTKGRVTAGASLIQSDIPELPITRITGLGSAASKDVGDAAGEIPVVQSNGKLNPDIVPVTRLTDIYPVDSEEEMLELDASQSDIAIRSDESKAYVLQNDDPTTLANWIELPGFLSDVTFEDAALTGIPTAPTATHGNSDGQIANTAFVRGEVGNRENLLTLDTTTLVGAVNEIHRYVYDLEATKVTAFGFIGSGVDTATISSAMASANSIIKFPKGRYNIASNLTLPAGKTVIFERGAYLYTEAGVTVTVNADVVAEPYPIFVGLGTYTSTVTRKRTIYPQWFGASNEGDEVTGVVLTNASTTSGSAVVTIPTGDKHKFQDGQTIMVLNAGSVVNTNFPTTVPLPTVNKQFGTPGSTTYKYYIGIVDRNGGVRKTSTFSVTGGPTVLNFSSNWDNEQNRIEMIMPQTSTADGWVVYGDETNPEGSKGILFFMRGGEADWHEYGQGNIDASTPPWIPVSPPTSDVNNNLVATILSGGGTTSLTLSVAAGKTFAGNAKIMFDNTPAINKAYDFLESCGGGVLEMPGGLYHIRTVPDTSRAIFVRSNIRTVSYEKAIFLNHVNPTLDNIAVFQTKDCTAHNWSYDGLVFDGGNRKYTTEYGHIMFNFAPFGSITPESGNKDFIIENCEFRYSRGKYISTVGGYCRNYTIRNNLFHSTCSNAAGLGGHWWTFRNNTLRDIFTGYGGTKVGGAEGLIIQTLNGPSNTVELNRCAYGDIVDNRIDNFGPINFGGGGLANYDNITISRNFLTSSIGIGGRMENCSITHNTMHWKTDPFLNGPGLIHFEMVEEGYAINTDISHNNMVSENKDNYQIWDSSDDRYETMGNAGITFAVSDINKKNIIGTRIIGNSISIYDNQPFYPIVIQHTYNTIIENNLLYTDNPEVTLAIYLERADSDVDHKWSVRGNIAPGKIIIAPSKSVIEGNVVGMIRAANRSIISNNQLNGVPVDGSLTWGGIITIGNDNIVTNNIIDLAGHFDKNIFAVGEIGDGSRNVITGNKAINIGTIERYFPEGFGSTVANNQGGPYDSRKENEMPDEPNQGKWTNGDRIYNNRPTNNKAFVGWICTRTGTANAVMWKATTAYTLDRFVDCNGKVYKCTTAGTTGSTGPQHINGTATDGTVVWTYVDVRALFSTFGEITIGTDDNSTPAVPTGLTGTPGNRTASLSWTANTDTDLAGYRVRRNGNVLNTTLLRVTSFVDTGLTNLTAYTYTVTATDVEGNESGSATITVTPADTVAPDAPTGLTITNGDKELTLNWVAPALATDVAGYNIYRNTVKVNSSLIPVGTTTYKNTGLTNGTSYTFEVTAVDTAGNESEESNAVSRTPGDVIDPEVPTGLEATEGDAQVVLVWGENTDSDLAGYNVLRGGVKINSSLVTDSTYTDTGLVNETLYSYTIQAVDESTNTSAQTSAVTAKPSKYRTEVFSDTFTRENSSTLGTPWSAVSGSFKIQDNSAESNAGGKPIEVIETSKANGKLSAAVIHAGNTVGLVFRLSNASNYWIIRISNNGVCYLEKTVSGTTTQVSEGADLIPNLSTLWGVGKELKVVFTGNTIDVYYDGLFKKTVTDSFNATATKHGMGGFNTGSKLDDFKFYSDSE